MQDIIKPSLIIINELGFVPFSERGAGLLFDVFANSLCTVRHMMETCQIAINHKSLEAW